MIDWAFGLTRLLPVAATNRRHRSAVGWREGDAALLDHLDALVDQVRARVGIACNLGLLLRGIGLRDCDLRLSGLGSGRSLSLIGLRCGYALLTLHDGFLRLL